LSIVSKSSRIPDLLALSGAGNPAGGTHGPRAAARARIALRGPALALAEIAWLGWGAL
jgi:hypothetical protein